MTDTIDKLKEELRATRKQFLEREKELRDLANALVKEKNDEIEKLREQLKYSNEFREIMNEERCDALEENERLREALQSISNNTCCGACQEAALVARAALKGTDNEN